MENVKEKPVKSIFHSRWIWVEVDEKGSDSDEKSILFEPLSIIFVIWS